MTGTGFDGDPMEGLPNTPASIIGVVPKSGGNCTEAQFHKSKCLLRRGGVTASAQFGRANQRKKNLALKSDRDFP